MSRARHKEHEKHHGKREAHGGRVDMKVSGNPDVFEEAAEKHKKGGRVKKKHEMHAEGEKSKHRMDRPRRARGGKVHGSDQNPFSSAKKSMGASSHEEAAANEPD